MTARLTPSERTVLILRANGRSSMSIARERGIRHYAVNAHEHSAWLKLGVESLPDAVWVALVTGVISRGDLVTPVSPVLTALLRATEEAA